MRVGLWFSWGVVVVLAACRPDSVRVADAAWSVNPTEVSFGAVVQHAVQTQTVQLINASRLPVTLSATAPQGFAFDQQQLELAAGTSHDLIVALDTSVSTARQGIATISDGTTTVEVTLNAEVTPLASCVTDNPCMEALQNAQTGECLIQPRSNGLACGSEKSCVVNGACVDGVCKGSAVDCSDSNKCTNDVCAPGAGCMHLDTSASCVAAATACQVGSCAPDTGCVLTNVNDGTACGTQDCSGAHICLSGQCVVRTVPEGTVCGAEENPCQPRGTCQSSVCVQPAATTLLPEWVVPLSTVGIDTVLFEGVSDDDGNTFALKKESFTFFLDMDLPQRSAQTLLSYSAQGVQRYAVPLPAWFNGPSTRLMFSEGVVVAFNQRDLVAFAASTGAVLWNHDFDGNVTAVAADGFGHLFLAGTSTTLPAHLASPGDPKDTGAAQYIVFVSLLISTGDQVFADQLKSSSSLVVDEGGTAYVGLVGTTLCPVANCPSSIEVIPPGGGAVNRTLPNGSGFKPTAAYSGVIALDTDELFSTAGTRLRSGASVPSGRRYVASSESRFFVPRIVGVQCDSCDVTLQISHRSGAPESTVSFGLSQYFEFGEPVLTSRDSVVVLSTDNLSLVPNIQLTSFANDGSTRFECALDRASLQAHPQLVLAKGHLIFQRDSNVGTELVSYAVPLLDQAPHGWVTPAGTLGRSQRPR